MKKRLILPAVFVLILLMLTGCAQHDSKLVGVWVLDGTASGITLMGDGMAGFEFSSDGNVKMYAMDSSTSSTSVAETSGTWETKDDSLILKIDDQETDEPYTLSDDGNTLTITGTDGTKLVFTKSDKTYSEIVRVANGKYSVIQSMIDAFGGSEDTTTE